MVVFSLPKYKGACTYLICSPLLKPYVGQARNFRKRMIGHKSAAKNVRINHEKWKAGEHNKVCAISFAINKYGWKNMHIGILEKYPECDQQMLDEREKHFISFYDSFKHGYNCTEGGGGNSGFTHTAETKAKMSANTPKRPVTSCLIKEEYADGTQLVEFVLYAGTRDAEAKTGVSNSDICQCCLKKRKSAGGRYWHFTKEGELEGEHVVPRIGDVPKVRLRQPTFSVSPAGEQQLHEGSSAAVRNLSTPDKKFSQGHISECCNGKRKTHHGYTFSYATPEQIAEFHKKKRKRE